jgi:hypothetical protein
MSLTDAERVKIRHHLGFLNVTEVATFFLGIPAATQQIFLIESAMNLVLPAAEPEVRRHLRILDGLEEQDIEDAELLAVVKVGEIEVNPKELMVLFQQQYRKWRASLANLFGVRPNPYDERFVGLGVNVPVIHG